MHRSSSTRDFLLLVVIAAALAVGASAQTTWTGAIDSSWDLAGNWTAGVPNAGVSATIPAAVPNDPSTAGAGTAACLDLDLQGGATLTVDGAVPITIGGGATLSGAVDGSGVVELVGTGTLTAGGATTLPNLTVDAGGGDVVTLSGAVDVAGDVLLDGGTFTLGTGATLTVGGSASFLGGVLSGGTSSSIDVEGDVTFAGTTSTAPPDISVAGDWTSDAGAVFAAGEVTFDGTVPQVVSAAAGEFFDLTLAANAFVDSAGLDVPVAGSITMGASADFSLVTVILLVGLTQELDPGGDLPNVDIASPGSVNVRDGVTIDGSVSLLYGKMCIDDTAEVTVGGDADFSGGTLTGETPDAVLDIAGDVTWNGATASSPPVLSVGGDWNSNGSFAPDSNVVEFDGGGTSQVFADGSVFADLRITRGTTVDVTSARVALFGDLEVPPAGGFTSPSTVRFVGAAQTVDPGGPLPNVEVAGPSVTFAGPDQQVGGSLRLVSGTLTVDAGAELDVAGEGLFEGGTLGAGGPGARLDVEGDCAFTGTTGTAPPDIDCAGDWSSDATFAPTSGTVTLDGAPDTTFGSFAPDFDPSFSTVRFTNGRRVVEHDLTLVADTVRIVAGGELDLDGNRVTIPGTIVDVGGRLDVDTAAELRLGGGVDMVVSQTGELRAVGLDTAPARITGLTGGGYQLVVDGRVTACGFEFSGMGPMGVVVSRDAQLSPPPFDLRNGTFSSPSPVPGSVLLDVERDTPTDFSRITFSDPLGVGTFNVRSLSSAAIAFVNYDGNFGGPAFEDTTNPGTITWIQGAQTQLVTPSLQTTGAEGKTIVSWQTQVEVDTEAFLVDAGPSPSGPWTPIGETPALGSGSAYALDHFAPVATTTCYRLSERLFHSGKVQPLGVVCSSGPTDPNPPNVLTVSPFGNLPTIGAALTQLTSGTAGPFVEIRVAAGTYPPFDVDLALLGAQSLHIGGLGNGPVVIDTAAGTSQIRNVPAAADVTLSDLAFGSPSVAPGPATTALVIGPCAGLVVLDRVDVFGGPGAPSVVVDDAARLAVQRCSMVGGGPDLSLDGATVAVVTKGAVEELVAIGSTDLRTCELTGDVSVGGSASLKTFPGRMPRASVDAPFQPVDEPFELVVDGDVGAMPIVRLGFESFWFDSAKVNWQLVTLVGFPAAVEIDLPPLGAAPVAIPFAVPAALQAQLLGLSLRIQPVTLQPGGVVVRFGHVTRLTFTL